MFFQHDVWTSTSSLNYATTAITSYVNLRADSVGFTGWFKGSNRNEQDEEGPITLNVRRKKSNFNVNHMSSCFVFEVLVELFNFSHVAYLKKASAVKIQMAQEYTGGKG